MTANESVTIWKSQGIRCILVPQPGWCYFQVQLVQGTKVLDVQAVRTLEAAYPIARRWQLNGHRAFHPTSAAA